jgi:flagellar biosynthesis/type III secretory pathway chaperone
MREIREKICELAHAYEEQLELYRRIGEVGSGEQDLIRESRLDGLLQVLKDKESLLRQAGEFEQRIKLVQEQLATHFDLETFSLPQLKVVAPAYYQKELETLEGIVSQLVVALEALEEQERKNEAALNKYLEANQGPKIKKTQLRLAGRAYGKK